MDILSVAWDVMSAFELSPYIGIIVLIAIGCVYFLVREYGKTWISHLLHRKNLPYVCGIFTFLCVFGIFAYTEVWYRFLIWVRGLQIILYGVYVMVAKVPDKYMVEISTLKMLNNGGFPIDLVIEDIKRHFNLFFQMPIQI